MKHWKLNDLIFQYCYNVINIVIKIFFLLIILFNQLIEKDNC